MVGEIEGTTEIEEMTVAVEVTDTMVEIGVTVEIEETTAETPEETKGVIDLVEVVDTEEVIDLVGVEEETNVLVLALGFNLKKIFSLIKPEKGEDQQEKEEKTVLKKMNLHYLCTKEEEKCVPNLRICLFRSTLFFIFLFFLEPLLILLVALGSYGSS